VARERPSKDRPVESRPLVTQLVSIVGLVDEVSDELLEVIIELAAIDGYIGARV
jgi:hypothetical protein